MEGERWVGKHGPVIFGSKFLPSINEPSPRKISKFDTMRGAPDELIALNEEDRGE